MFTEKIYFSTLYNAMWLSWRFFFHNTLMKYKHRPSKLKKAFDNVLFLFGIESGAAKCVSLTTSARWRFDPRIYLVSQPEKGKQKSIIATVSVDSLWIFCKDVFRFACVSASFVYIISVGRILSTLTAFMRFNSKQSQQKPPYVFPNTLKFRKFLMESFRTKCIFKYAQLYE